MSYVLCIGRARLTDYQDSQLSNMKQRSSVVCLALFTLSFLANWSVSAQWISQSFTLKQGWNAVYLHVDASHETLDNLVGAGAVVSTPIEEIWMWTPVAGTTQFVQSPQDPINTGSQWTSWKRSTPGTSNLQRLIGNVGCLVYSGSATDYIWTLKGRPKLMNHEWNSSGLNFLGFPTSSSSPPHFESFLAPVPSLLQNAEIYEYPGGELGANNPTKLLALRTTPIQRGRAVWMRAGTLYNRYYGPFSVGSVSPDGIQFGSSLSASRFGIKNQTSNPLTVTVNHLASETEPSGQTSVVGAPPLLLRETFDVATLTYGYTGLALGGSYSWNIPANGEIEVVLGINRAAINGNPGDLFASFLRFTDSLGHSEVDMAVSAVKDSNAGLWVGEASVTHVRSYLKTYQRDATGTPLMSTRSNDFGSYITTSVNTNLGTVPRAFPLRLILHTDTVDTYLFQRLYHGMSPAKTLVNATSQTLLDPNLLASARRISAIHLPATPNNKFWKFTGSLQPGSSLTVTVDLPYDAQSSNPFLHTYHPDHDNLDARFSATSLAAGFESYNVSRVITLAVNPPDDHFSAITRSGQTLTGVYSEAMTFSGKQTSQGPETKTFETQGTFTLQRINNIATLSTQ